MSHEKKGASDEWYTPKYIFDSMGALFDLDVASPKDKTHLHVTSNNFITEDSLNIKWNGFVWMNPPFGDAKNKHEWIEKFINHGNGVALMPDRSSSSWWQYLAKNTDAVIFLGNRVKFIDSDGKTGDSPTNGTCLFSIGKKGREALMEAERNGLGKLYLNT